MSAPDGAAAEEFARLAVALHDGPSIDETVEMVVDFARQAIAADHASVVLVHGRGADGRMRVETAAASDADAAAVDAVQAVTGEGPDLAVLEHEVSVTVADTRLDPRWPAWAERVADLGIRSVMTTRMHTTESVIGTLNLYSRRVDAFDVDDQAVAHVLGRHAAVALASVRQRSNLLLAVDARKRIGQAQGILMERFDLNEDQAFAVLKRYSQDNNIKLRRVADTLVETRALPE